MRALRLGLVGHPVAHSRSPALQQAWGEAAGIPLSYALFDVLPADLEAWLAGPATALDGFNVTAPHKEAIFQRLTRRTLEAERLGAVNTVRRAGEGWLAHNTDLIGFKRLLGPADPLSQALVLGAGGAARAVVAGLADRGIGVQVAARRPEQAEALLHTLGVAGAVLPFAQVPECLGGVDRVVDCVGAPELAALPWARLPPTSEVITLAYGASAAPLLAAVQGAGRQARDGWAMLVGQGQAAFEFWTDVAPDAQEV